MSDEQVITEGAATPAEGIEIGNAAQAAPQEPQAQGTQPQESVEVPQYTPNLTYRVHDEEKKFDDFLAQVIKDKETEEKVRVLYEKAGGLDFVKPKFEETRKQLSELQGDHEGLRTAVQDLMTLKENDIGQFFKEWGLSDDTIAKYILEKANRQNLPPEQRQVYDNYEAKNRETRLLEKRLAAIEAQSQNFAVQARTQELESVLQKPDVSTFAQNYDAIKGPGAFKAVVVQMGELEWHRNRRDISAMEATKAAMSWLGNAYVSRQGEQGGVVPAAEKELPVIPRVGSKNVSAVGKQVKSLDDLRKIRAEMSGA